MPIYEYECLACGIRFERRQSVKDDPIKDCPECSGRARKVLHPVGIIFKGSGFYITDSRKSQSAVKASEPSTASGGDKSQKSGKTDEAKTDVGSKSDAKAGDKAASKSADAVSSKAG